MRGAFKVKNAGLQPLYARAQVLAHDIGRVTFEHVGRALNAHADRLANEAMDEASDGESAIRPSTSSGRPEPVEGRNPQSAIERHPFSALERAVRLHIYRHFVDTTRAPQLSDIATAVKASESEVAGALRRLADAHAIVLAPSTLNIWMAHPFSAVPTAYPVDARGRRYWANCAWDAAGVLSLVGDGETRTRCTDCGTQLSMTVRNGAMEGNGVVHFAVPPRRFWENVAFT